MKLENITSFIS